ncbi:hypothetical protein ACFYXW_20785 [Streptomyces sp. NPDC001981]|uniref:hypothetical protein n=1 Tax=Streptomyces sp. NPDC001981 TaxID=3364628 RepID=UPI0036B4DC5C
MPTGRPGWRELGLHRIRHRIDAGEVGEESFLFGGHVAGRIGCGHREEGAAARPVPVGRDRAAVGDLRRRCDRIAAP